VKSYRDLPKMYNQWCSVVRWEKTTRPFLRGKEFLWQEGHTVHATAEEAKKETHQMLEVYDKLGKELLAIPFVTGRKTDKEKFAGALETYAIEALMHDGQALQSGTSHYFGNEFAHAFDIKFTDESNQLKYAYQTSWGVSTRLIGAVIMVHGDDNGLVLPPYVAPTQIVIVPIKPNNEVQVAVKKLSKQLSKKYRVFVDDSSKSPGWKFSEHEMKGVPLRIEVGPRDLEQGLVVVAFRHTHEKVTVRLEDVSSFVKNGLKKMHDDMYQKALDHAQSRTYTTTNYDEFKSYLKQGGYIKMSVSGEDAEIKIKEETGATARVILKEPLLSEICPVTGKKAKQTILFARAY